MSEFGLKFSIGARLSSSVASSFASLDARMRQTQQTINRLANASRAMNSALELRSRRDELIRQFMASGRTDAALRTQLENVSRSYRRARAAALEYGNSVEQWRERQAAAAAELERTRARMERLRGIQAERGNRQEIYGSLLETVAPAAGVVMPVKLAIDFESSMADAAKTMDGMRDASGKLTPKYYEMQNVIKSMGRELPLTHEEIARLFAAGGQLGMSDVGELKQFSTMSAQMAVAFGMSSEEAAESIGTFRTALKMSLTDVGSVLDLMNKYANTSSAKEKDIAETLSRIGSLGNVAGVSAKPMTALAATLAAVGTAPDVAATGIQNMLLAMTKGTAATKGQKEALAKLDIDAVKLAKDMQRDGPAAIVAVLKKIKQLKRYEQLSVVNELFGTESIKAITPFVDKLDLAIKNLELSGNTAAYAGSMQEEFANRSDTTANKLRLASNQVRELGITIGSHMLKPIGSLIDMSLPLLGSFNDWAAANPTVVTSLMGVVGGLAALKIGMLTARLAVSGVRSAFLTISPALQLARGGMGLLGRGARRAAGLFSISWGQAFASARAGIGRLRTRLTTLGASITATAGRLRRLGVSGLLAGTRAMVAGGMARASRAGWNVLRMGIRGVGRAFRTALGPVGLIMTALSFGAEYLIANWDKVAPFFTGVWEKIKSIFNAGLSYIQPIIDTIGKGLSLVGDAWDWAFGDEEKEKLNVKPMAEKAAVPTLAEQRAAEAAASGAPSASAAPPPALPRPAPASGTAAGPTVGVGLNVTLQGMPDAVFAEGVMRALKARSGDVERLISDIVHNQARLAYGS